MESKERQPPLGVLTRELWIESRADDLIRAISDYREAGKIPPVKWADELLEHLIWLSSKQPPKRSYKK